MGGLPPEDQKIFREAALRSSQFMREKWRDLEERSRKQAEDSGVTIVTDIDRKPFEAAMAGIYTKARHDPADRATDRTNSQGGVSWPQPRNG